MATQLQTTKFCDTGFLSNVTDEKKQTIIALSIYQRLGLYDQLNKNVKNYKNKDIIHLYHKISKEKQTKTNTLLKIYDIIQILETRIEQQNKNKSKSKNQNKTNNTKTT